MAIHRCPSSPFTFQPLRAREGHGGSLVTCRLRGADLRTGRRRGGGRRQGRSRGGSPPRCDSGLGTRRGGLATALRRARAVGPRRRARSKARHPPVPFKSRAGRTASSGTPPEGRVRSGASVACSTRRRSYCGGASMISKTWRASQYWRRPRPRTWRRWSHPRDSASRMRLRAPWLVILRAASTRRTVTNGLARIRGTTSPIRERERATAVTYSSRTRTSWPARSRAAPAGDCYGGGDKCSH